MILNDRIYKIFDKLIRCVYPKECPICKKLIPISQDYCSCSRYESRKISDNYCRHCGYDIDNCCCKIKNSIYLPDIAAVYIYSGKVRADILNLKFNNEKRLAVKLGTEMAERCANVFCDVDFDLISFVPMSENSYNLRTYNQSQLLANQIGKLYSVPVESIFVKTRKTAVQHELKGEQRTSNLKNSVALCENANIKGKNILICDDVKTTGSTLHQCVELLEKAEAGKVCCICVALSDFHANSNL